MKNKGGLSDAVAFIERVRWCSRRFLFVQEDRRAAQKKAAEKFVEFLDDEYVSLGITYRTIWRDVRDSIDRKAPAETDVLDDPDRRRLFDNLIGKLIKVIR